MIELKTFYEQAQKLRIAQKRRDDLREKEADGLDVDDELTRAVIICNELECDFDNTLYVVEAQLRISPEQIDADANLTNALEVSLKGWRDEQTLIQKELIDQSLIDARTGGKSNRYRMLEKRDKELTELISEAERKLGKVSGRVAQSGIGNIKGTVDRIINAARAMGIAIVFALGLGGCDYLEPVVGVDPQLKPYVDSFFHEAELRGFYGLRPATLNAGFKDIRKGQGRANVLTNTIVIDPTSNGWKYNPEALVFHELGHLILRRKHLNKRVGKFCVSIMSNLDDPIYDIHPGERLYDRRKFYVDELFKPWTEETEVPEWMIGNDSN